MKIGWQRGVDRLKTEIFPNKGDKKEPHTHTYTRREKGDNREDTTYLLLILLQHKDRRKNQQTDK